MNDWSRTRKRIILLIVLFILVVLIGAPLYFLTYQGPTCSDGTKNGDETGVDCGGSCQRLCTLESLPIVIRGDPRVLVVATTSYEVVALLENPNSDAEISHARYTLKLYSAESLVPIKNISGETYVPKAGTFVIFEGPMNFDTGVVPNRVILEWDMNSLVWEKNTRQSPQLLVEEKNLTRLTSSPRLEALIANPTLETVSNIDLTALLYDQAGSIFAASKTFIDSVPPGAKAQAIFTWPRPFPREVVEIEVLVKVLSR